MHHLVFDPETQTGTGEYTYQGSRRYHGIVIVRLRDGLISYWREYEHETPLTWEEFAGPTRF